jgi:hypothetical protein
MDKTYTIKMINNDKLKIIMTPDEYIEVLNIITNSDTHVFIGNTEDVMINVRNISTITCQ